MEGIDKRRENIFKNFYFMFWRGSILLVIFVMFFSQMLWLAILYVEPSVLSSVMFELGCYSHRDSLVSCGAQVVWLQ